MTLARASHLTSDLENGGPAIDPEVARLAATIDLSSPLTVQEFGKDLADRTAAYTDHVLAAARGSELSATGSQLSQIVMAAKAFDIDSLDNSATRIPVLGKLMRRFVLSRERALSRFDSVKTQVDKLVAQVEGTAEMLHRRNRDFQAMYEGVSEEHRQLGLHVQAIQLRLSELDATVAATAREPDSLERDERVAMLTATQNQMRKRSDDLAVLQHSALQTLPMVRIIQSNNLTLIDKFQSIRQLTLPAWKRAFMLMLTLDEQRDAVQLADTIDDATNDMLRRNAQLLRENSIATAKSNQRLVVDIETLREVHKTILTTLAEVQQVHDEGQVARRQALLELDRLRGEMRESVNGLVAEHG